MLHGDLAATTPQLDPSIRDRRLERRGLRERYQSLPPSTTPILLIVGVVVLGNFAYLSGFANSDPISWTTSITHSVCGLICGRSSTDINVGVITQPLGHLAATDLLHGRLPWWNAFEGLGQPLAGEMQSAALFPLVVLLALPGGLLWLHVVLEVISGVSTFFLARRLGSPATSAVVAGALFALNGTFAWLANTVVNPIAFLPMLLLGIEIVFERSSTSRRGWFVLAAAVAFSIYAGFPEVAYLDGLLCVVWALVRLNSVPRRYRATAARRVGIGVVLGTVASLPALVAFGDFLRVSYVGGHVDRIDGSWSLSVHALPMLFDPYLFGTIYGNARVFTTWGEIGGYFGATVCVMAIVGLFGSRLRGLRLALALWLAAGLMGTFNLLGARSWWNVLPFLSSTSLPRYVMPSCELALIVLATLGLGDLATLERTRRRFVGATLFMVVVLISGGVVAHELNYRSTVDTKTRIALIAFGLIPFVGLALLFAASRFTSQFDVALAAGAALVVESVLLFTVPTIGAPRHVTTDVAPIAYLQSHQGEGRFVDLTVLPPNWGSEFGLNALNATDLPFPRSFEQFIQEQLYPGNKPGDAFTRDRTAGIVGQETELATHLLAYEEASVKYLLAPRSLTLLPALAALHVTPVWHDATATIYALPHPRSFFSSSCDVTSTNVDAANVTCSNAGATLLRTELSMPGWTASVNGTLATIHTVDGVYQAISLPQGASVVDYRFVPPHEDLALALGLVAFVFLCAWGVYERKRYPNRKEFVAWSPSTSRPHEDS
ncbi:MAG TPA: hypothetical protein VGE75_07805 [Acidimicrobiales bacterium]|jgi:hypothetical protein